MQEEKTKFIFRIFLLGLFFWSTIFLNSCSDDTILPKPKSYLYMEYPVAEYHRFVNGCHYSFGVSKESSIVFHNDCGALVYYPKLDATVHITYRKVQNDLREILLEADKLTSKHTVKADVIIPFPYENKEKRVFGLLNEVQGASASNVQFYVTDSVNHVLTAALYFKVKPNYDSLYPAIDYLKNDMMHMIETLEWK